MSPRLVLALLISLGALAGGCGRGAGATGTGLTVFAAASLGPVLADLAQAYAVAPTGTRITTSSDSSAALATQIEHGAPADLFLAAAPDDARRVVDAGLAVGDVVPFAGNRLVLLVPDGNPAGIRSPADLARPGVKLIAAGGDVPISRYAARLVENLARLPGYPAGFTRAYAANVVSREDSVAGVVARIALGEGDAGIAYATDAARSDGVRTIPIPDEANVTAIHAGVVVRGPDAAAARALLDWLVGPAGQGILAARGFLPAP